RARAARRAHPAPACSGRPPQVLPGRGLDGDDHRHRPLRPVHGRSRDGGDDPVTPPEKLPAADTAPEAAPTSQHAPTPPSATSAPSRAVTIGWAAAGLVVVVGLAWLVQFLVDWVPDVSEGTGFGGIAKAIEYPVYAIILGFAGNALLTATGLRDRMVAAFRTEFFIKV